MLALPGPPRELAACPAPVEIAAAGPVLACDGRGVAPAGPARRVLGLPIDPNRASALTLETLPGIGPARAAAIVAARARQPFHSAADLARVPGIGPHTVAGLSGLVAVGEAGP